jgi:divalent metal cation (Fe/Co/Zn/Cd) transporter
VIPSASKAHTGIAVREIAGERGTSSWWQVVERSKDPSSFIVLFEHSAALIGLILAGIGVWASHALGDPRIDGIASILIGVVLALVAMLLARESKGLIIGESADPALTRRLRATLQGRRELTAVNHVRTIHTAPETVFVAVSADFVDGIAMGEAERLIEEIEQELRAISPKIGSIYIRPERQQDAVAFDE